MNKKTTLFIWIFNFTIIITVLASTFLYVRSTTISRFSESQENYKKLVNVLTDIANNYLRDEKTLCRSWNAAVNDTGMHPDDVLDFINKQKSPLNYNAHLVWKDDFTGYSTQSKASDSSTYTVDYNPIKEIFADDSSTEEFHITPRYINPMDGDSVISFYSTVTILDNNDSKRDAYLLHVIPEKDIRTNWSFPTEYGDKATIALINQNGSYILKPPSLKNESFYDYIYSFNRGDINTDDLQKQINEQEHGSFQSRDYSDREVLWTFNHLASRNSWILISTIPLDELRKNTVDLVSPLIIFFSMLALLIFDILIYLWIRKGVETREKNLSIALAVAEQANQAKTSFLNNMSHDIRTPMNAIIGYTALAAKHLDNKEKTEEYLSKITTSSSHLLSLINDILDMSRIESGKVTLEENEVDLSEVLHGIRTILQTDITSKRMEFYIDALDVKNETVICDRLRLNQILLNLLSNAVKFTQPGGTISLRVIQKKEAPAGYAHYEFHVKDNGIGISKDFIQHIFEPFEREKNQAIHKIQGTGLGMSITKNLVTMMGGEISVQSEEGKGSEFIVNLTFKTCGEKRKEEPILHLKGLNALVADDDTNTCFSVCKMLEEIGMRTEWTTSGKEAVIRSRYAMEKGDKFAVYIIDWLMPDMNGIEVVRRIRKEIADDTPIIILTAYDWTDIEEEAREAGVTAFCAKPLFMSELHNILRFSNEPDGYSQKQASENTEEPSFVGKRLLLVEDNLSNQEIASTMLQEVGFDVDIAGNGAIAVDKVAASPSNYYDLIFMDLRMPEMNGFEATHRIRALKDKQKSSVPIVAMTANAFSEDIHECFQAGMNDHIAKPIDRSKLLAILQKYLNGNIKKKAPHSVDKQTALALELQSFYREINGDYSGVLRRLIKQDTILHMVGLFMEDDSYRNLKSAINAGNITESFYAAHTLKGVSGNLGFTELYDAASRLTEQLRPQKEPADSLLFDKVTIAYDKILGAWSRRHLKN